MKKTGVKEKAAVASATVLSSEECGVADESAVLCFCRHLIEACWLMAAGVVPLLLDPLAADRFLPVKTAVLNSLGMMTASALFVLLIQRLRSGRPRLTIWFAAAAALLASYGISTVLSIHWRDSLLGGDAFLLGSLALFCHVSLFVGVATCLRTREQMQRLISVTLAASLPLALFAVFQRLDWDPLSFAAGQYQPASFAGNAIIAAGTLLFSIPLCVWRLTSSRRLSEERKSIRNWRSTACYSVLLLIQIAGLLASYKRGPFIGFLAVASSAGLLYALYHRRYHRALGVIAVTASLILGLAALAFFARDNPDLKRIPGVKRLAMIVPVGSGTGDVFRQRVWEKSPGMIVRESPTIFPDGKSDRWWHLRPVVGFGPETLPVIFPQHLQMPTAAPGANIESRLHNSFWDTLQSVGLLGLVATLLVFAAVYSRGFAAMGLRVPALRPWRLMAAGGLTGMLAGFAMELFFGSGFFGLGFPIGFAGGLILLPLAIGWRGGLPERNTGNHAAAALGIALLSGLTGHWVDMCFSFPTANTSALGWIFAGWIVALGCRGLPEALIQSAGEVPRHGRWLRHGLLHGLLAGGMLAALCHAFITDFQPDSATGMEIMKRSLTQLVHNQEPSHLVIRLLLPAWLGTLLLLAASGSLSNKGGGAWKSFLPAGFLSLGIAFSWSLWKAGKLATSGGFPAVQTTLDEVVRHAGLLESMAVVYLVFLLVIVLLMALSLRFTAHHAHRAKGVFTTLTVAAVMVFSCAYVIRETQLPLLRAHASGAFAQRLEAVSFHQAAAVVHQRVLSHNPRDTFSRIQGSKAFMAMAERSQDTGECLRSMRQAEEILVEGLRLNNRSVLNYFLGNVYMRQAFEMQPGKDRQFTAQQARKALEAAVIYSPYSEAVWFDASIVAKELLGDESEARAKIAHADKISAKLDPVPYGEQYVYQMQTTVNPVLNPAYGRRALAYYSKALEGAGSSSPEWRAEQLVAKGTLLVNLRQPREAVECLLEVTQLGETGERWRAHAMLNELYLKQGDRNSALMHLDQAISRAPAETRRQLQDFKARTFR